MKIGECDFMVDVVLYDGSVRIACLTHRKGKMKDGHFHYGGDWLSEEKCKDNLAVFMQAMRDSIRDKLSR